MKDETRSINPRRKDLSLQGIWRGVDILIKG
jgi:hypothetical protein